MSAANVGRVVVWNARGYDDNEGTYHRQGVIVEFVPARASMRAAQATGKCPPYAVDAMDLSSVARYLVRADRTGARGQALKTKWYAPHASVIDAALAKVPAAQNGGAP